MSTASNRTIRMPKPSFTRQPQIVAGQLHPLWLTGSWEDMVAMVSLAVFAATLLFFVVVG
jgi:hypothetical protein